jgi:hypothetical protein
MKRKMFLLTALTMVMVFAMAMTAQACPDTACCNNHYYCQEILFDADALQIVQEYLELGYSTKIITIGDTVLGVYLLTPDGYVLDFYSELLSEGQIIFMNHALVRFLKSELLWIHLEPARAARWPFCCGGVISVWRTLSSSQTTHEVRIGSDTFICIITAVSYRVYTRAICTNALIGTGYATRFYHSFSRCN